MRDRQDSREVASCRQCGGEIYALDLVHAIDGNLIHEDCIGDYMRDIFPLCIAEDVI